MTTSTLAPQWLDEKSVSELTQIPVNTLRDWRRPGKVVLPFAKIGRLVRYDVAAVHEYLKSRQVAPQ